MNNLEPVFTALGKAIHEAQILELILVQQNIAHRPDRHALDETAIARLEQSLGRDNLGTLLRSWKKKALPVSSAKNFLQQAKDDRDFLAHRLFREVGFDKPDDLLAAIERVHSRIRVAQLLILDHEPKAPNA